MFDLAQKVALMGIPTKSHLFESKVVLAKTSKQFFVEASAWRNQALMSKIAHADDPEMMQILWDETMKEASKGFVDGPFSSLEEVKDNLASDFACVTRHLAKQRHGSQTQSH